MPDKMNLDLINMVQRGRIAHDSETQPSHVTGIYWIETKRPEGDQPGPTPRAGYWWLATTLAEVDAIWAKIKAATEAAQLGYKSKVSTASRDATSENRVIHVLTYDSSDQHDVDRVRAALASLDIPGEWHYHTE